MPQSELVHSVTDQIPTPLDRGWTARAIRGTPRAPSAGGHARLRQRVARRAGIERTSSQGMRRCGMRHSRYRGLARTHLGHVLTAAAINSCAWRSGWREYLVHAPGTRPLLAFWLSPDEFATCIKTRGRV